jgi:hypothetical protein
MEPWVAVVCAVAVGLVAGLLVLSAGIIGRFLLARFRRPPKASQLTLSHAQASSGSQSLLEREMQLD